MGASQSVGCLGPCFCLSVWAFLLQDVYYKLGIPPEDVVAVHELRDLLVQVS